MYTSTSYFTTEQRSKLLRKPPKPKPAGKGQINNTTTESLLIIQTNPEEKSPNACTCQRKYKARNIWSGADHSMFRKVIRSMNRWASTDIKLTISPTVDERFAEFVMTKD